MMLSKEEIKGVLGEHGLRATGSRIAVFQALAASTRPLSHSEVLQKLGTLGCDPATVYRNLVKLKDAGLAPVVSRIDGIERYALVKLTGDAHNHPHFSCDECGLLTCLPHGIMNTNALQGPWAKAVQEASIQLHGQCPECT